MMVKWVVVDGYVNGRRPQYTEVDDIELAECETEEDRQAVIKEFIEEDFKNSVSWYIVNE